MVKTVFNHCRAEKQKRMEVEANSTINRIRQITAKYTQKNNVTLRGLSSRAREALDHRELPINKFPFHFCRKPSNPGPLAFMEDYLLLNDNNPYEVSQNHCQIIEKGGTLILSDKQFPLRNARG